MNGVIEWLGRRVACLAKVCAISFPWMLEWLGIHWICTLRLWRTRELFSSKRFVSTCELISFWILYHDFTIDWLTVKMINRLHSVFSSIEDSIHRKTAHHSHSFIVLSSFNRIVYSRNRSFRFDKVFPAPALLCLTLPSGKPIMSGLKSSKVVFMALSALLGQLDTLSVSAWRGVFMVELLWSIWNGWDWLTF